MKWLTGNCMASNTTLRTYTVREKGIPPTIQVLGGWRVKAGSTNPRSRISKSVCCAISLPPFYASLLAEVVPGPLSQWQGSQDPVQCYRLPQGFWGNCRLSKSAWKTKQSMNKPLSLWQRRSPEEIEIFPAIGLWEGSMETENMAGRQRLEGRALASGAT